jgi:RIO kinase 2
VITLIDFPQMVSVGHANAEELFDRDVAGVVKFFHRKLGYRPEEEPRPRGQSPWPVFKASQV